MAKLISKNKSLTRKKCKENLPEICMVANGDNFEIANLSINNDVALVYLASISGNVDLLKKFIDSGFPVNSPLKTLPEACPILQHYSGFTAVHFAFKYQKLDVLQFLLSRGANIFIPDDKGITPLHIFFETKKKILQEHASVEFYDHVVDIILQTDEQNIRNVEGNQVSHFHIACTRDEPETIQNFLHKNKAYINEPVGAFHGHEEFSPLHFALTYKCDKVVKLLLNSGANVNQVAKNNRTALHFTDSPDLAQLLLQFGADFTLQDSISGNTPLHKAFEERNYKMMDVLLSAHINNNANPSNAIGISHFHIACMRNNEDIVKLFLQNRVSVNSCVPIESELEYTYYWDDIDWRGCSPLHFAVAFNKSKIVELLLSENASVRTKDARGFTALHLACRSMHEKIEELIMDSLQKHKDEGTVFKTVRDRINWKFHRIDHLNIIKMLLKSVSDVNSHDNFGNTPVYGAYAFYALVNSTFLEKYEKPATYSFLLEMCFRRKKILELLLHRPVDFDTCLDNGSILHYIIKEERVSDVYYLDVVNYSGGFDGALGIFEMFLKNGASVDALNQKKVTPLFQAIKARVQRSEFIELLIKYRANLNFCEPETHSSILHVAWNNCRYMFVDILLKGADPNAKQSDGTTVLHLLTQSPDQLTKILKILLEAGVDVNARYVKGRTPLFSACLLLHDKIVKMLLDSGADINIEDDKGKNVLSVFYEELMMNNEIMNKKIGKMKELCSTIDTLLDHVRERRTTVSEAVLLSREKIIDYYFSNILFPSPKLRITIIGRNFSKSV